MRLYAGPWTTFVADTTRNQIAEILRTAYRRYYGHNPSVSESTSWRASLEMLKNVGQLASLQEHGIVVEYQLPLASKRLDAMITGHDRSSRASSVVVELKQWQACSHADGAHQVVTFVGGAQREVNHPSAQVQGYVQYLRDVHAAFHGPDALLVHGCGFLHNYDLQRDKVLLDEKFQQLVSEYPLFGNHDFEELAAYLQDRVGQGGGIDLLSRVEQGTYRPSKKLMVHVAETIAGQQHYVLLDEQRVVFDKVKALVDKAAKSARKQIVLVKGGPGTGKSVIALHLMGVLAAEGRIAHYATGSKSFTETLREIVGKRAGAQFKYFNSYMTATPNALDVLICDEAHRIRTTSNDRFTPSDRKSDVPQLAELVNVARVLVLFIDDHQAVRPGEIGRVQYVHDHVRDHDNVDLHEYELVTQFRCGGSEAYISWVNDLLGIEPGPNPLLEPSEDFEFEICSSPEEVEQRVHARLAQGMTARMMAGFCWPWSDPDQHGALVPDVKIGAWERPWNAKPGKTVARGIPSASLWAYQSGGEHQVGCIYSAQGFEFDYAGVIVGADLTYDLDRAAWVAHPDESYDTTVKRAKSSYLEHARNLYRVLLTRGMKGCCVYFVDKDTERFVRSRMRTANE